MIILQSPDNHIIASLIKGYHFMQLLQILMNTFTCHTNQDRLLLGFPPTQLYSGYIYYLHPYERGKSAWSTSREEPIHIVVCRPIWWAQVTFTTPLFLLFIFNNKKNE